MLHYLNNVKRSKIVLKFMKEQYKFYKNFLNFLLRSRELPLFILIIILCIAITIRNPSFITIENFKDIINDIAVYSILAIGEMIVIITGGIDLSIGTGLGLAAMISGMIIVFNNNIPPIIALLIGAIIGGILGAFNGLLIAKGKIVPLIATLATLNIFRGLNVVINLRFFKSMWVTANILPDSFKAFAREDTLHIPNLLIIIVVLYIAFYYLLNHTVTGREFYAVGSNENAARISGININKVILLAYIISGILFGLSGVLYASRYAIAQTDTGIGFEFIVITAVILGGVSIKGGKGTIVGVLMGTILMGIISNALSISMISPFWKLAINGSILLIAVVVNKAIEDNTLKKQEELRRKF